MQFTSKPTGRTIRFLQLAGLAGALGLMACGTIARADEFGDEFPDRTRLDQLERTFWQCERAAATIGMSLDDGLLCAEITEQFKNERFHGDFDELLQWWTANKPAALAAVQDVPGSDMVP